jgi:2-iminobutanoate/2-iminopropanoate deaminase
MTKVTISTPLAPSSPLFSQGVRVGSTIYVSGMVGVDTTTGALAGETIQSQTEQALRNCFVVVEAGGGTKDDIAQVTVLLTRPGDFAGMNEAYAAAFPVDPPARAVAKLGVELPGILVSITVTAQLEESRGLTVEAP